MPAPFSELLTAKMILSSVQNQMLHVLVHFRLLRIRRRVNEKCAGERQNCRIFRYLIPSQALCDDCLAAAAARPPQLSLQSR